RHRGDHVEPDGLQRRAVRAAHRPLPRGGKAGRGIAPAHAGRGLRDRRARRGGRADAARHDRHARGGGRRRRVGAAHRPGTRRLTARRADAPSTPDNRADPRRHAGIPHRPRDRRQRVRAPRARRPHARRLRAGSDADRPGRAAPGVRRRRAAARHRGALAPGPERERAVPVLPGPRDQRRRAPRWPADDDRGRSLPRRAATRRGRRVGDERLLRRWPQRLARARRGDGRVDHRRRARARPLRDLHRALRGPRPRRARAARSLPARVRHAIPREVPGSGLVLLLLAVKSQDTPAALEVLAPRLATDGAIVSLQNGLNEELIAAAVGARRTVGCLVNWAADWTGPGRILHGGEGALVLGELDGRASARVQSLAKLLDVVAPTRVTDNILGYTWAKHVYGALLVATAVVDAHVYEVVERSHDVQAMLVRLVIESMDVAEATGIKLQPFDEYDPADYRAAAGGDVAARQRA